MIQLGPKTKLGVLGVGLCIIVFGRISIFFNVQEKTDDIPLENDILQTNLNTDDHGKNTIAIEEIIDDKTDDKTEIIEITQPVTILFPPFYEQKDINTIITLIYEQSGIKTKPKKMTSWEQYSGFLKRFIKKESDSIDIIIAPSDRWESFSERGAVFELPEQLQRFYHQSFTEWMYEKSITVVPLGLDPLLLFSKESVWSDSQPETIHDILTSGYTLGIGFDEYDQEKLIQKKEPFINADIITKTLIKEALRLGGLDWIVLIINNNQRDSKSIRLLEDCSTKDPLCLVRKNHTDAMIAFLSDSNKDDMNSLLLHPIPWSNNSLYPTRGRGMIINKHSSNKKATAQRIESFITLNVETNTIPYPSGLLGSTYSMLQRQLLSESYMTIQVFQKTKTLIQGTIENDNSIIFQQSFIDAISGIIDQKFFMQKMSTIE